MKILVTGSTGFIGTYVISALLDKGYAVIASSANSQKAVNAAWYEKVNYIEYDLAGYDETIDYYKFFSEPDLMIHLAWEGLPNYKSDFHETVNLPRHKLLITNLVKHGLKDLTVVGTCFEYGMKEGCLREDMIVHPENSYAKAKNELRIELEALKKQYPFSFKWVRLFYMYGVGQHPNSLLSQLEKALENGDESFNMSGGEQVRDYLPVEQVAENVVAIASQMEVDGIINNCSGHPVTIKDLVLTYLEKKQEKIKLNFGMYPYPDYEPMRFWGDDRKLNKILKK